jgi:hypothetical protein
MEIISLDKIIELHNELCRFYWRYQESHSLLQKDILLGTSSNEYLSYCDKIYSDLKEVTNPYSTLVESEKLILSKNILDNLTSYVYSLDHIDPNVFKTILDKNTLFRELIRNLVLFTSKSFYNSTENKTRLEKSYLEFYKVELREQKLNQLI